MRCSNWSPNFARSTATQNVDRQFDLRRACIRLCTKRTQSGGGIRSAARQPRPSAPMDSRVLTHRIDHFRRSSDLFRVPQPKNGSPSRWKRSRPYPFRDVRSSISRTMQSHRRFMRSGLSVASRIPVRQCSCILDASLEAVALSTR